MRETNVIDAVERWFKREYGPGYFCGECVASKAGRADLVYVLRADSIHVVEAKRHASSVRDAFRQLARYPGNYKWFALPMEEYDLYGDGIATACSTRGYGLLLVGGGPSHRIVIARRIPVYSKGRFDHRWSL